MKKIVSIISIFAIILSATQFVLADYSDDTTITDGQFAYKKGTNNILAYVGTTGICEIPENTTLKGLTPSWAKDAAPITKLIINDNVDINMIISGELVNLNKLKEVEIKEGVTEIPYQFLKGCNNLENITLPSTIEIIDDEAFSECSKLSTLDLNDGLQSIGRYAFSETTLSGNLNIPDTVTHMDVTAFTDCGNLDKVHMSNNIECEKDKKYCYWFPQTDIKEINIPDTMLNCTNCYFHGDEITFNSDMTVNIYNKVQDSNWCDLKYLKGKTDKSMGNYKGFATAENTILRYIGTDKNPIVPDGITVIGKRAFTYCDIDTVELPNSLTQIGEAAFYLSTLKDITIPKNVKKIEDDAFDWCPFLEKVTINGNTQIGSNAILVSDRLSENKIEVNNSDIKNRILSFGISEYELPAFYELINSNRELIGWNKVEEVEPTETTESTTKPTVTVPTATALPTTVPTKEPTATVKPSETTAPTAKPKKLTVETGNAVTVKVDSTDVVFPDAQPFVDENGRTQVPIRAVSEMLDCKVDWDDTSKTATITKENGDVVKVTLGSDVLTVNNKLSQMDTTAIIKDDRTFIPVRFVAEALGLEVEWLE